MKHPHRILLALAAAGLLAGCQGKVSASNRINDVKEILTPAQVDTVLGRPGHHVDTGGSPSLMQNILDQSTISRAEYQTNETPIRFLKVRLIHKPTPADAAVKEYFFVKDEFSSLPGLEPLVVTGVGEECAGYTSDEGKNLRLVARNHDLIVSLHIRGEGTPANQMDTLKEMANHLLAAGEDKNAVKR